MAFEIGLDEVKTLDFWRAVLAEFIASVVFLVAVSTAAYNGNTVAIALTIGLAIATLAQCIGSVSGGHINPAVSFAMIIARKVSVIKGLLYIFVQCIGGITGSGIAYSIVPEAGRSGMAVNSVAPGMTAGQGFGLELVFTFLLVLTVFAVTDGKRRVETYGTTLAIGISIVVCHLSMIPLTGCGINPARSIGPAVVMNRWEDHWIYWIGPLLGAALAAVSYEFVFYVNDSDKAVGSRESMEMRNPSTQA